MNLYDRAASLSVALDTASEASQDKELLERGRQVVEMLDTALATFAGLASFRSGLDLGPIPFDTKKLGQSARQLRTGITKHQAKALQHATTGNFEEEVRAQVTVATKWARAKWKESFNPWTDAMAQAEAGDLVGNENRRRQVRAKGIKLRGLAARDPLAERPEITESLGGTDVTGWVDAVGALGTELTTLLAELGEERQSLSPAVQDVLARAAADGLPLDELTPELLADLGRAGVLSSLVVRRA
jgi:hypothetical protein